MKKLLFLTLLLIGFTTRAQQTAISLPQLNVLYIGVDNPVTIAVESHSQEDIVTEFINGDLIKKDNKTYLRVNTRGEARLKIGVKKWWGKVKWLEVIKFRVRSLPKILPQLGTLQDGAVVAKSVVQANAQRLFLSMGEGFVMAGVLYQATSFDVTIVDSVSFRIYSNTGAVVNPEIKAAINNLSGGGKIWISNVNFRFINQGDTFTYVQPLTGTCEITIRPQANTYIIEGGFSNTPVKLYYNSYSSSDSQWGSLANYTRHGKWVYKTGACSQRVYQEEWYDSGRLVKYQWYDTSGFTAVSLDIPANSNCIYYRELFNNGSIKRTGTVIVNCNNCRYAFRRSGDYDGPESLHPFQDFFPGFRFVPASDWKEYYPSGKIRYTGSFTSYSPTDTLTEIKPAGNWTEYDEAGNIISQYNFGAGHK